MGHGVRVGERHPFDRVLAVGVVEALRPGRHRETGTETLEVPLPRSGQRLVEVVHIEDQPPLGRSEPSEVDEMGVPGQLHGNLRGRASRRGPPPSRPPHHGRNRTATLTSAHSGSATGPGHGSCLGPRGPRPDQVDPAPAPTPPGPLRGPRRGATAPTPGDRHDRPRRFDHRALPCRLQVNAATPCFADGGAFCVAVSEFSSMLRTCKRLLARARSIRRGVACRSSRRSRPGGLRAPG